MTLTGDSVMDATSLRAMQAPIKERYKGDPSAAMITLKAKGSIDDANIACKVETGRALAVAGLHPATGGSGLELRSEEHTSELQSLRHLVCRLLLEKKTHIDAILRGRNGYYPRLNKFRVAIRVSCQFHDRRTL